MGSVAPCQKLPFYKMNLPRKARPNFIDDVRLLSWNYGRCLPWSLGVMFTVTLFSTQMMMHSHTELDEQTRVTLRNSQFGQKHLVISIAKA